MMACLDVHYKEDYQPGQFYLRELSPLLAVIERIAEPVDTLIIDAYCYLSADYTPGLGAFLYSAIGRAASVIGVAKNRYKTTTHAEEVFRGGSSHALFVTSVGFSRKEAAAKIASMAGPYRIPALLKAVDQLARGKILQ
jgi:deoxyribonuclease V